MWSIVVPVFNEQDSLRELVSQLQLALDSQVDRFELLFIDDGSSDDSWSVIQELAAGHEWVRGIKFRRNFGKAAALAAGFDVVQGNIIITMDADLQDDPLEIPKLVAKLDQGYDVVSGWKKVRQDPWHKVWPSRIFNRMISWLTQVDLHDHNCGLKAYRRQVLDEVQLYGEMHRFVPVLAAARGFKVSELAIQHKPRAYGSSKYGFERFIKGFLDLLTVYFLTGFKNRPQHLLGTVGLASFAIGFLGLCVLAALWVISRLGDMPDVHLHEKAIFYFCILALLFGAQLISLGFLAELITAQNRPASRPYSIEAETDGN
ncbi:MAG: glycosyltransferase family 2 protein [bacterium]|nr:glycosyltransferase family 2 protein [bacterium]